jgi:hypothetical protein
MKTYYLFIPTSRPLGEKAYINVLYNEWDGICYECVQFEKSRFAEALQQLSTDKKVDLVEVSRDDLPHPNAPESFYFLDLTQRNAPHEDVRYFTPKAAKAAMFIDWTADKVVSQDIKDDSEPDSWLSPGCRCH